MRRYFTALLVTFASLVALAVGQENPPGENKKPKEEKVRDDKKDDAKDADADEESEDPQVIINRLKDNEEKSVT